MLLVKMLVGAAGDRSTEPLRWRRGGTNLIYHAAVFAGIAVFVALGDQGSHLMSGLIGFGPVLLRSVVLWWRLVAGPPDLHTVGLVETSVALWFSVWTGILISRWPVVEAM